MISENSKFELRHVLYCDLLGFSKYSKSEFFEAARCFRLFKHLDQLITDASKQIEEDDLLDVSGRKYDYIVIPEVIYCSDSLVISTPATNIDAMWLFEAAARIQNSICAHGFLLRGAIVTGNLYHSGNTIFGPAIVDAVAKDKPGSAPVIVIDENSLNCFCLASSDEDKEIVKIRRHQLVAEDDHDSPYIDPFWMSKIAANQTSLNFQTRINLDCWRTLIETGLKNSSANVVEKYRWMANRFNKVICNKASNIKPIVLP
ncbi:hypothetical protein [Aquitalea pelogenes]|uniref:hypothetical protein n=1 Tax=Aquitalea pelogenes TaxID=1293573 RepID=UPI0035B0D7A6